MTSLLLPMFLLQKKEHNDLGYTDKKTGFQVKFLWAPEAKDVERKLGVRVLKEWEKSGVKPDLPLLGFGLWSISQGGMKDPANHEPLLLRFKQGLQSITPVGFFTYI